MKETDDSRIPPYRRLITGIDHYRPGHRVRRPGGSGDWLVMLTVSGGGRFSRSGRTDLLLKQSIVLIPRGMPHDYGIMADRKTWSLIWAHFQPWPHWNELMRWPEGASGALVLQIDDPAVRVSVETCLRQMHADAVSAHTHREIRAMNMLEQALLLCDQVNPLQSANMLDARIQASIDHVHEHLVDPVTVDELARVAGLSASRFAHLFTVNLGVAPLRYVENQRIDRARDLLAVTSSPVAEVGEAVGFPDPYYFSRRFSKATGMSPREYRNRVSR